MTPLFFLKQDMLTDFFNHINAVESSINFTMEKENNGSIAFLDTLITRMEHGQLSTKVYRKPTHTGRYLHFRSEQPLVHKRAVLNTLLHRAGKLCDEESEQKKEIDLVRSTRLPRQTALWKEICKRNKEPRT